MLVCQATLFDYAFAEISIPQFPILPTVLLERFAGKSETQIIQKGGTVLPVQKTKTQQPKAIPLPL